MCRIIRHLSTSVDMTKKSYAIAYWLLPETAAREVLSHEIAELAKQFSAPFFEPHVTDLVAPHLSLLYAKLPEETKQTLSERIRLPFRKIHFNSICAMRCPRPTTTPTQVEQWKLLAR